MSELLPLGVNRSPITLPGYVRIDGRMAAIDEKFDRLLEEIRTLREETRSGLSDLRAEAGALRHARTPAFGAVSDARLAPADDLNGRPLRG